MAGVVADDVYRLTGILVRSYAAGAAKWARGGSFLDGLKEQFDEEERKVKQQIRRLKLKRSLEREAEE